MSKCHLVKYHECLVLERLGSSLIGGNIGVLLHDVDTEAHFPEGVSREFRGSSGTADTSRRCMGCLICLSCSPAMFHEDSSKYKSLYFNPYKRPFTLQQCFDIISRQFWPYCFGVSSHDECSEDGLSATGLVNCGLCCSRLNEN